MHSEGCLLCEELLDRAAAALLRHIQAVERMDRALLRGEDDLLPALEIVVREAQTTREDAMARYRHHVGMHEAKEAFA